MLIAFHISNHDKDIDAIKFTSYIKRFSNISPFDSIPIRKMEGFFLKIVALKLIYFLESIYAEDR